MLASEISRSIKLECVLCDHGSDCLEAFARSLRESCDSSIEAFLDSRPPEDRSQLAALIAIEMRHRLERGQVCRIEDYLERFPELKRDGEQVLDLIYAEYCERRQRHAMVDPHEYYKRFPNFHKSLERLFRIDRLFEDASTGGDSVASGDLDLPDVLQTFPEFRLKAELGRGGFGRVFLAEQMSLSDRYVVLKITRHATTEHRTLARLAHPNIVPILSVHHENRTGLHAVCMPYLCGVALSDVRAKWSEREVPTEAECYLRAVTDSIPPGVEPERVDRQTMAFPVHRDFVYASAWIMHQLAGALHHAHLRGIYHRDLKPSNILLTVAGQPQLMDFNLSFDELEGAAAFLGGTLPYMAPEQLQAIHPTMQGRADDVGPRADIYSLAATMFELLTGQLLFALPDREMDLLTVVRTQLEKRQAGIPSIRSINPNVPADFDALLTKCLDPVPHQRYESAAQLAEDLQRFFEDRPLRYVSATPLHVRLYKYTRRNRRRLAVASAIVAVTFMTSAYVYHERRARGRAETLVSQLETSAEKEADEAMSRLPKDANLIFSLGFDYFRGRRYAHALRCFNRVLELNPDHSYCIFHRGRCYANMDRDEEALADYSACLEYEPDNRYVYLARAVCYATSRTNGNPSSALEDVERAVELIDRDVDDSEKTSYLEVARVYSAVSSSVHGEEKRGEMLRLAEKYLFKAVDLGITVTFLNAVNDGDRFRMLDPVFKQPRVKHMLMELTKSSRVSSGD